MLADEFMNAEETARYLGIGKNSVYQLAKSGALSSYRIGRKIKFTREDADAFLAQSHLAVEDPDRMHQDEPQPKQTESESDESLVEAASFDTVSGNPFVIAGGDAAADIIAHALNEAGISAKRRSCGSYTALVNLYAGEANAAVVHLYDQASNNCTVPYVRNLAPGVSVVVLRLYARTQGLIVAQGNPKKLTSWGALLRSDVHLANRTKGSGARILLDEKLRAMEVRCETIEGYSRRASTGAIAIDHVAKNAADVTIGCAYEMRGVEGVQFVPLQSEWVDIVIWKTPETRGAIRILKDLLASDHVQRDIASLDPDDISKLGVVIYES